ncbi:hypothetical protein B0T18DRAFT_337548 [Schizothecium vesticola]|uniref:Uncharacterized protein n=1 Tax=Schizothecium vesticola TaxID=314040 RepID=A0AA40F9K0_9PEZI|nr:hypothetical protein B0T18DRAFT_337548 [Schizothecium vesticola]
MEALRKASFRANFRANPSTTTPIASIKPLSQGKFPGLQKELSDDLEVFEINIVPKGEGEGTATGTGTTRRVLIAKNAAKSFLPGQPRIRLDTKTTGRTVEDGLLNYLRRAHLTNSLDELLPYMRYVFVQTPSYRHIMPLHHQRAHLREVVINENPGLHLVWYYDKIFVKPIPAYFYSKAFWTYIEHADPDVYQAVVGFMRSYNFLIQYEVDFAEACRLRLIPDKHGGGPPTYEEFCDFVEPFTRADDHHVNRRFHYGELRLTRINRAALLFKRHLAYFHMHPQWGSFMSRILAPVVTVFAIFSVALNSMQVALQALQMTEGGDGERWRGLVAASLWFPVVLLVLIAVAFLFFIGGLMLMASKDLIQSNSVRRKKKEGGADGPYMVGERSHGMVW